VSLKRNHKGVALPLFTGHTVTSLPRVVLLKKPWAIATLEPCTTFLMHHASTNLRTF